MSPERTVFSINFCAQAAEIVHVASLPSRRNGRSRQFRQKNTMVSAQIASQPRKCSRWLQGCPRCLQRRQTECSRWLKWLSKGLPEGSSFKIPPLGFLLWDSFLRIPLSGFLQDSFSRIPPLGFLLQDAFSKIPSPGFLLQDPSLGMCFLGFLFHNFSSRISLPGSVQGSSSRIPPPGFFLQDSSSSIFI